MPAAEEKKSTHREVIVTRRAWNSPATGKTRDFAGDRCCPRAVVANAVHDENDALTDVSRWSGRILHLPE